MYVWHRRVLDACEVWGLWKKNIARVGCACYND